MPLILHIETATEVCSVCLSQGLDILAICENREAYTHAAELTLLIESCMQQGGHVLADLDGVAISQGPGSYTSLRVGTSTAKGICYALDKPLIAVDTLQAMALASRQETDVDLIYAPMIDARRMEVYTALFDKTGQCLSPTQAMIIDEKSYEAYWERAQGIVFSGNGAEKCRQVIRPTYAHYREIGLSATHLVPLAVDAFETKSFVDTAYFSPEYFKSPNITVPKGIW